MNLLRSIVSNFRKVVWRREWVSDKVSYREALLLIKNWPLNCLIIIVLGFSHVLEPNLSVPFWRLGQAHLNQHSGSSRLRLVISASRESITLFKRVVKINPGVFTRLFLRSHDGARSHFRRSYFRKLDFHGYHSVGHLSADPPFHGPTFPRRHEVRHFSAHIQSGGTLFRLVIPNKTHFRHELWMTLFRHVTKCGGRMAPQKSGILYMCAETPFITLHCGKVTAWKSNMCKCNQKCNLAPRN